MQLVKSDAFLLGQEFAKHYPSSVADMISYQKLHDTSEIFTGANLCNTQQGAGNKRVKTQTEHHGSSKVTNTKRVVGGIDAYNHNVHKPGKVTNVRHSSNRTGKSDMFEDEDPKRTSKDTKQYQNLSSYLNFSQWKMAFDGRRSITSWMEYLHLPTRVRSRTKTDLAEEALDFMKGVMDECTHLGNFCTPVDPSLIIIVAAKYDAYVPRDTTLNLQQLWPGCEVRYVNTGHVGAFLTKQHIFRLVYDTLEFCHFYQM